ncbi:unnamed protein product [Lepidochelys olivacea]
MNHIKYFRYSMMKLCPGRNCWSLLDHRTKSSEKTVVITRKLCLTKINSLSSDTQTGAHL